MLMQVNEAAAREYMARDLCAEYGFELIAVERQVQNFSMHVQIRRGVLQDDGEKYTLEEPDPANFPSEAFKQKLMLLA